jgi:glycosyltransferase involved in cell wall biosynthesis
MKSKKDLRVLHSAGLLTPSSGMLIQMQWEFEATKQLGINWEVKMYCPSNAVIKSNVVEFDPFLDAAKMNSKIAKFFAWIFFRWRYHTWLFSLQNDVDIFILRYYVHDPFQLWFALRAKKPVYFLHHSLEVPELAIPNNFPAFLRSNLEALIGQFTLSAAKGLICVTKEILSYERKRANIDLGECYIYPNGIKYSEITLKDDRAPTKPELLFVANFAPWHGLDLLMKEIKNSNQDFILHVVGDIPKELVGFIDADERVIFHGKLNHESISDLSQRCWIGLSSFALYRKKMTEACPLKVREYLMMGLPAYGDCKDVFPESCAFYRRGSESIDEILDFARNARGLNKSFVSREARKYIDKKDLLSALYSSLSETNKSI